MKVVYALEPIADAFRCTEDMFPNGCLFLVGPTPRSDKVPSWRPGALEILENLEFKGDVFVPEPRSSERYGNYNDQIEWEWKGLDTCVHQGAIAAWVPRDLETMPAFTTNVEIGYYVKSEYLWYGRPPGAPKSSYLDALYLKEAKRHPCDTLEALLKECLEGMRDD